MGEFVSVAKSRDVGEVLNPPTTEAVPVFRVRVEGDDIQDEV